MNLQQYIKVEQTKKLYQALPAIIVGTIGVSILAVLGLWRAFPHHYLVIWCSVSIIYGVLRWLSCGRVDLDKIDPSNQQHWRNRAIFWSLLSGLHWGLIPVLFFDSSEPTYVLFITCLYAGYASASMSANSAYYPSFLVFAMPASLIFAGKFFIEGGPIYTPLAIVVLFYISIMIFFARRSHDFFIEARELNYRNLALMDEVVAQKETAEAAVRAKNQFLAAASHDLRQPLHAMNLFVDALLPLQSDPKGQTIVGKIKQSMSGLNGMLHSLLDISRLDASSVKNQPQHHSLNQIVEQLCEEYRATAMHLSIHCALDKDYIIFADATLVERILRNLVDNAVKYSSQGEIQFSASTKHQTVQLELSDTGIGIPDDQLNKVFDEFHQLNNPERSRQKGLGLGLAIVKRLCELTNIDISLQSKVTKGTTVTLAIPIGLSPAITKPYYNTNTTFAGLSVVVIDDEQDILDGMQELLLTWGCEVVIANNAAQAIEKLSAASIVPKLVIADFRLQDGENGLHVINNIWEEYNLEIPAILVTGDTALDRIIEADASGIDILYKPIESGDLKEKIQALIT